MEFLDGRIFEDARLLDLSPKDREECWLSTIHALTALSSIDPSEVGLDGYGPPQAYFPRQLRAFSNIASVQGATRDIDTNEPVQQIPYHDPMLRWFQSHFPDESITGRRIVHGDYKLDNLVFHPTENRVIGILDWELSTLGSPLADFANLTQPWSIKPEDIPDIDIFRENMRAFKGVPTNTNTGHGNDLAPIQLDVLEREYCRLLKLEYPLKDFVFVRSWMLFRVNSPFWFIDWMLTSVVDREVSLHKELLRELPAAKLLRLTQYGTRCLSSSSVRLQGRLWLRLAMLPMSCCRTRMMKKRSFNTSLLLFFLILGIVTGISIIIDCSWEVNFG